MVCQIQGLLSSRGMAFWRWLTDNIELVGLAVGVALGVPGIALAVYYQRQNRRKTLDYLIVADQAILAVKHDRTSTGLEVKWRGVEVDEPRIVAIRLINTGSREVLASDYGGNSVVVRLPHGKILSGTTVGRSFDEAIEYGEDFIMTFPDEHTSNVDLPLLNPKDWIAIQLTIDGRSDELTVKTRFAGQSRPMRQQKDSSGVIREGLLTVALGLGMMILGLSIFLLLVLALDLILTVA